MPKQLAVPIVLAFGANMSGLLLNLGGSLPSKSEAYEKVM
jgi:hypothetical protein